MKEAVDDTPIKLNHGYPMPRVVLAVGIALAVHGALLGATMFSASGKTPDAPAANAKADAKKTDGAAPAPVSKEVVPAPDKVSPDGPAADTKSPDEPKKVDKPAEPTDELKLDTK